MYPLFLCWQYTAELLFVFCVWTDEGLKHLPKYPFPRKVHPPQCFQEHQPAYGVGGCGELIQCNIFNFQIIQVLLVASSIIWQLCDSVSNTEVRWPWMIVWLHDFELWMEKQKSFICLYYLHGVKSTRRCLITAHVVTEFGTQRFVR